MNKIVTTYCMLSYLPDSVLSVLKITFNLSNNHRESYPHYMEKETELQN